MSTTRRPGPTEVPGGQPAEQWLRVATAPQVSTPQGVACVATALTEGDAGTSLAQFSSRLGIVLDNPALGVPWILDHFEALVDSGHLHAGYQHTLLASACVLRTVDNPALMRALLERFTQSALAVGGRNGLWWLATYHARQHMEGVWLAMPVQERDEVLEQTVEGGALSCGSALDGCRQVWAQIMATVHLVPDLTKGHREDLLMSRWVGMWPELTNAALVRAHWHVGLREVVAWLTARCAEEGIELSVDEARWGLGAAGDGSSVADVLAVIRDLYTPRTGVAVPAAAAGRAHVRPARAGAAR